MEKHRITISVLLLAVLSFAASLALFRIGIVSQSKYLVFCGLGGLVASVGWPVGYLVGGVAGAYYGALLSVGALFVLLIFAVA